MTDNKNKSTLANEVEAESTTLSPSASFPLEAEGQITPAERPKAKAPAKKSKSKTSGKAKSSKAKKAAPKAKKGGGVIVFEDDDETDNGVIIFDESESDAEPSGVIIFDESEEPEFDEGIILFDEDESPTGEEGVILFEDEEPDDSGVLVFEDIDDTYLNQVELVDRRLEKLRGAAGVVNKDFEQPSMAAEYEMPPKTPLGKDLLGDNVDTLIAKLITQSSRNSKNFPPVNVSKEVADAYTDVSTEEQSKITDKKEIDDFVSYIAGDDMLSKIYNIVSSSSNKVSHSVRSEALVLDDEWINTIENGIYFIEEIVKNPKKFIIDEELIVDVERARKTSSKSVRHLAQNTRNISKIDDDGFVTPKKILTVEHDEDLAIYENRFVSTLITRLVGFVESRKTDIESKFRMYDISQVAMKSNYKMGNALVECNFELSVKETPRDNVMLEKALTLVTRINNIAKRLRILKNSNFMRQLSGLKPIVPPINKTNIIKMNVNYSTCYKLWLFISAYTFVGYSVEVKERRLPVDGKYFEDLAAISAISMRSVLANEVIRSEEYMDIEAKPPKKTRYKVVNNLNFTKNNSDKNVNVKDEAINEYYFRKIQEFATANAAADDDEEENTNNIVKLESNININYERFCKSIMKISNDIITDTLKTEKTEYVTKPTLIKRKRDELKRQKDYLDRVDVVAKAKAKDLEKILNEEARLSLRVEKLQAEVDILEAREEGRKARLRKAKQRNALELKDKTIEKSAQYKRGLIEKRDAELDAAQQRKESAAQQRQRERELKMLARLKEKYDNEDITDIDEEDDKYDI